MDFNKLVGWMVLTGFLLTISGVFSEAGEPQDKIRQTINEVLAILADKALQAPERTQDRRTKLRQAVSQHFGFEEMAQRALGPHWKKLTGEQKQEFVSLFSDLLEPAYSSKIESYGGSQSDIRYIKETIDTQGYASVRTEIATRDLPVEVEYRLLHHHGKWEVYDVVIEGVSLVNNYRTQFNKIIVQESYAALVKQMQLKREQEKASASTTR
jgi:phospholipid transport system substrate-binding protein